MARSLPAEERRGEILDQAFGLFAARGYHALSMRDLARELGASTGVLYHWFPGKPELYAALLERQVSRQVGEALATLALVPEADRLQALGGHIAAQADDLQHTLVVALDWLRAEPDARGPIQAALQAWRGAMAEICGLTPAEVDRGLSIVLGELLQRVLDPGRSLDGLAQTLPTLRGASQPASGAKQMG